MNPMPTVLEHPNQSARATCFDSSRDSREVSLQILFESEFVALVLVKLKRGQHLRFGEPALRLLTVVEGRVRMHGPHGSFVLEDFGRWRLERGESWKIRATTDACVSLFVVKPS